MGQLPDSRESQDTAVLEPVRQDFQPVSGAGRKRWPITDQIRQLVVDEVVLIVRTGRTPALQIAAAKVLLAADLINARREATWDEELAQKNRAAVDAMIRSYMAMPPEQLSAYINATLRDPCSQDQDTTSAAVPPPPGGLFP